jgi:hypothetical protein
MLPGELVWILGELGYNWPEADEQKLFELANTWMEFSSRLQPIAEAAGVPVDRLLASAGGEALEAFRAQWSGPDSALDSLRNGVSGAQVVGPGLMIAAAVVLALKITVIIQLTLLVIQIAQAIATAPVSFGATLAEIPIFKWLTGQLVGLATDLAIEQILG